VWFWSTRRSTLSHDLKQSLQFGAGTHPASSVMTGNLGWCVKRNATAGTALLDQRQSPLCRFGPGVQGDGMMLANILTQAATGTGAMAQTVCRRFRIELNRGFRTYPAAGMAADAAAAMQTNHPGHQGVVAVRQVFARRLLRLFRFWGFSQKRCQRSPRQRHKEASPGLTLRRPRALDQGCPSRQ